MQITVIGTSFVDIKGHPFGTFIPDGRNAGYIEYVHGGVGRNIAEDIARIGAETDFVSLADPGGTGDDLIAHLASARVNTSHILRSVTGCGTWLAVFDEAGDVASSISVRPDLTPLAGHILAHGAEIFSNTDAVILEADIDTAAVEAVFSLASRYGKKVYCAVATMSEAMDKTDFLKQAEFFICNSQEAGMLFGRDLSGASPQALLELLPGEMAALGMRGMIVTMSEKGAVYCNGTESGCCPAEKAALTDSTGAGDSFCAGVVAALTAGLPLAAACRAGSRVAASVVSSGKNVYTGPALDLGNRTA